MMIPFQKIFRIKNLITGLGFFILVFWVIAALLPCLSSNLAIIEINLPKTRVAPVASATEPLGWLGYDSVGSSVLLHVLHGAGVALRVGFAVVIGSLAIGVPAGALAGYLSGWVDTALSWTMDVLLAFPPLILPILIAVLFGGGMPTVILALCAGGWIAPAKIVRSQFRVLRSAEFVVAARALGAKPSRILFLHMMPNAFSPLLVQSVFIMAGSILAEAGLSFLGVGLGEGYSSWGSLLNEARAYLIESPHLAIFPSLAILSLVVSLNVLGDALNGTLDPRKATRAGGSGVEPK